MQKDQRLRAFLNKAEELEREYEWLGAIEFHEKALGQVLKQKDFLEAGDIEERIGYCLSRGAFQAESLEIFKQRMREAIGAYEIAQGFYNRLVDEQKASRMFRCRAVVKYLGYWLVSEASEKKRLIDDCWMLTKKALKAFEEAGSEWEHWNTFEHLSISFDLSFCFEWDYQARQKIVREAIEHGERAIKSLSTLEDPHELARAYVKTANYLSVFGYYFLDLDGHKRFLKKARDYWRKACVLSEDTALLESVSVLEGGLIEDWGQGTDEALTTFRKALECSKKTRDKFIIGCALDFLAYHTFWKQIATDDRDEIRRLAKRALEYAAEAKNQFSSISFISPRDGALWAEEPYAEYYWQLAEFEVDLLKRRKLLQKSLKAAPKALERAKKSGYSQVVTLLPHHVFSKILLSLAKIETNLDEKRKLLGEALKYRTASIGLVDELEPFNLIDRAAVHGRLADIKSELANLTDDPETKKTLLQEAIMTSENSVNLTIKGRDFLLEEETAAALFAHTGNWQYRHGELLNRFYHITKDNKHLRNAATAIRDAADSFQRADMKTRIAECHWKVAQIYDNLDDHLKAHEDFQRAANYYKSAAKNNPQLRDFYKDYAVYMKAWNEIEKAKHHHAQKRYGRAKEHYDKATNLHKSTERWSYLGPNYLAWSQLEEAEDISRREEPEKAKNVFERAAKMFADARKSLEAKLEKIEITEEKAMAAKLIEASDTRQQYCLGRIALEEAKTLDRQGDHTTSSKKYGSAAEIFQKIAKAESDQSRKELQPIIYLCQAWQKMMMGEAKASSTMYGEAAELFKQAKDYTLDQPTSLLALANSSFCKALEAGTEFEITRDMTMYSTAKKHMEAAANYYLKAGFKNASEYVKATLLLFDVYMYITKAETETDPARKAQFYQMAEKILPASASSYMKAKHPEKSEEVKKLLRGVKEKRQLAMSLTELLHAPTVTSTTTSFSTPTPTHEKAVGLERFERTDIQANLTASDEVTIGEEVKVRLDLVNVAKESGLLVRVDNLVPPGFKVTVLPSQGSMENGSIDLKGKKIDPLKVETVKLSLQATEPGVVNLSPQVVYVNELGKFRMHRLEPVAITVHPKLAFTFKTEVAQRVFSFLVSSFVKDYMRRRISLEKAGWRTLMEIVKHGKVPKSSVYGAGGHRGRAVAELEKRGLVETRIFLGERGRGGKILKMRISYDKETIKRHIDQRIMKIKEK